MRMWMVDPKIMCRQHLLGEHLEIHMFVGTLKNNTSVEGYKKKNLLEIKSLGSRHEELVNEMKRRYFNHNSPLDLSGITTDDETTIDSTKSLQDLLSRCSRCKQRYERRGCSA